MYDRDLAKEILFQILRSLDTVIYRFAPVKSLADLTDSPSGMEKLDSICMQLIAIGEGLKNFDKITNYSLLHQYPEINWKGAKAMRDIISHHYFEIDAEIIFEVCQDKIRPLRDTIKEILDNF
jgi:uncharacterized protein with HEPN domain